MALQNIQQNQKPLTIFRLVMMSVIAIDSLKNLPANAQYGSSLLFFYLIATVAFFIPSALVAAELATGWPETGGVYVWVREAFGKRMAFISVWTQWLYQLIWYPTILSFIAVTIAYFISPSFAQDKNYILLMILSVFWIATLLSCFGLRISSNVSTLSALIGVIIPMLGIALLGIYWIYSGHLSQIHFNLQSTVTHVFSEDNFRLFVNLLFSLMGIEMVAVHAGDVKNPVSDYPKAIVFAAIIILATVIPSSLAIATVISPKEINLTSGVIEAFTIFLDAFHLAWLKTFVIMSVAIGSFGIFMVWLLSSARCLLVAANDDCLPQFFQKTNQKQMPVALLLIQGIIFTVLSSAFILMPSVNSAFWLLTASSAQLALIYYVFLFASALKLRYEKPNVHRPFRVGKSKALLWGICLLAIITCIASICFGFLPPPDIAKSQVAFYDITLCLLIVGGCGAAWIIYEKSQARVCNDEMSAVKASIL
ncbi:MAG TPA: amino acid permease [Gammaproteobacteria bacterium]|nr:amino acid permease [Gammaproteobacteria bacterium]